MNQIVTQDNSYQKILGFKSMETAGLKLLPVLGIEAWKSQTGKLTSHSFLAYIIYIPVIFMVWVRCLPVLLISNDQEVRLLSKTWINMINHCLCRKKLRALFWAGEILKEEFSILEITMALATSGWMKLWPLTDFLCPRWFPTLTSRSALFLSM